VFPWAELTQEATFTTVAEENQGPMNAFGTVNYIINDTIWNRSLRRPVFGPLAPQRWQQQKAMSMQGPWNQFRIRNDYLLMIPAPAAGQECYFEYITFAVVSVRSDEPFNYYRFLTDDDNSLLDEELITLGIIWRFKAHKGFDYEEDKQKYEAYKTYRQSKSGGATVLSLNDAKWDIYPGIVVPSGSWSFS
jgi:hypothetical protein